HRRFGIDAPRVGLLSIGEEPGKGTPLVKDTYDLLQAPGSLAGTEGTFIGNVEGRDLMSDEVDVVVTDGFTGNVALKTLEGGLRSIVENLYAVFASSDEAKAAAEVLLPMLAPLADQLDPDTTGGAMLLGTDGVCIISHGSSSPRAIVNAVAVARDMVEADLVGAIRELVTA
ncbi:MAG: phosphate acyltransferase, partial [Actinomycetota bacterium]